MIIVVHRDIQSLQIQLADVSNNIKKQEIEKHF